jgi:hypothetical protein
MKLEPQERSTSSAKYDTAKIDVLTPLQLKYLLVYE